MKVVATAEFTMTSGSMPVQAPNGLSDGKLLIWNDFAAYSGPSIETDRHSHFYAQICLAIDAPLRLKGRSGWWQSYNAAFVPSGISHQTEYAQEKICILLLNPINTGLGLFGNKSIEAGEPAIDISGFLNPGDREGLLNAFALPNHEVRGHILNLLQKYAARTAQRPADSRIVSSIQQMLNSSENFDLDVMAKQARISTSRFRHLFRDQTGITFSGYRLWLKTRRAILQLSTQTDLTRAALEGGFADQAHFSRIFRRSFGMSPSHFAKGKFKPVFFGE